MANQEMSYWRLIVIFLPGLLAGVIVMFISEPIPQPQNYHLFADQRIWLHIPHAGDVLSNLAFIIIGGWGLWFLSRPHLWVRAFINRNERRNFCWLFMGVFLTGFGSSWYHHSPDNYRLALDRLPMSLAFMGIFAAMITERVNLSLGIALLKPLLMAGVASVLWWIWTEYWGHGDLRFYLIVQFYPIITMVLMLLLLPTAYTHGNHYWGVLLCYLAAKLAEMLDHQIFGLTHGVISGHNLKHLFAALAVTWVLRMLWMRQIASTRKALTGQERR